MTNRLTRIGLSLLTCLVASCASSVEVTSDTAPDEVRLTPSGLLREAANYDGQSVVVRGYLRVGSEMRGLWDSKEEIEKANYAKACVTVYNPRGLKIAGAVRLVDVRGVFHTQRPHNLIILGDCTDAILEIEGVKDVKGETR